MRYLIYLTFLIVLTSCHKEKQNTSLSGPIFGTSYNFLFEGKSNSVNQEEIDSLFAVINQSMSTYMADSDISKINRNEKKTGMFWLISARKACARPFLSHNFNSISN